jgi:hypothetical protein
VRSSIALKFNSSWLAALFAAIFVAIGFGTAHTVLGWFPTVACCFGTLGIFILKGVRMRLAFLCATVLWIVNNVVSGSIGGTALECVIFVTNGSTIVRMIFRRLDEGAEFPGGLAAYPLAALVKVRKLVARKPVE